LAFCPKAHTDIRAIIVAIKNILFFIT